MAKMHDRKSTESDCFQNALERMEYVFDTFDHVCVSFSGGKDSTACLNLALKIATEKKRLPLDVVSFDEEAIPPETVEYMQRVADRDDIRFRWFCIPLEHRNACSSKQPYWYCWAPEDRKLWVRDLPPSAITEPLTKKRCGIPDLVPFLYDVRNGLTANILGIRTQESITRYRSIASKSGKLCYIKSPSTCKHVQNVYPIYDWMVEDVWIAPEIYGWDYNRAYETMTKAGIPFNLQRCCPPFGEQPIRGLHLFKTCWPQLWAKMVDRVHGAATAARYANTDLYGVKVKDDVYDDGMDWRSRTLHAMNLLSTKSRAEVADAIAQCISTHRNKSPNEMPDLDPDPISGYCWKDIYLIAKIGGNKFGRQTQKVNLKAFHNLEKAKANEEK